MMELFWTPEARQDRDEIYDYIEADNPTAALALDELFAEKAGRLVDHTGLGRPGRVTGTRELVAHQNYTFRHPDLGGSLFGTSNQRVDHFRAGLGMAEGLFG
jgi:toxin ParE1/3/4